jgi:nucleotide-binding universal stress UspA family protein
METQYDGSKAGNEHQGETLLVAVDFSDCCRLALRKARILLADKPGRIFAIHVIDEDFVTRCIQNHLGEEDQIKKTLFMNAKTRLSEFLREESLEGKAEPLVCLGIPYLEINRKATELGIDTIIMGSCGKACDMSKMFFGSTTEKVLRFITKPVLCIPPDADL